MASMELFGVIKNREVVQLLAKVLKQADEIEYKNNFYYTKELLFHSQFSIIKQRNISKEDMI